MHRIPGGRTAALSLILAAALAGAPALAADVEVGGLRVRTSCPRAAARWCSTAPACAPSSS